MSFPEFGSFQKAADKEIKIQNSDSCYLQQLCWIDQRNFDLEKKTASFAIVDVEVWVGVSKVEETL